METVSYLSLAGRGQKELHEPWTRRARYVPAPKVSGAPFTNREWRHSSRRMRSRPTVSSPISKRPIRARAIDSRPIAKAPTASAPTANAPTASAPTAPHLTAASRTATDVSGSAGSLRVIVADLSLEGGPGRVRGIGVQPCRQPISAIARKRDRISPLGESRVSESPYPCCRLPTKSATPPDCSSLCRRFKVGSGSQTLPSSQKPAVSALYGALE